MHTSAQPLAEYTGTLTHQAEARMLPIDHAGHLVPGLCLDIELDNSLHTHMHVEQPFTHGDIEQARAAAHRLKKGVRVTVQAPLVGLRLVAGNAAHIHVLKEPQETQPCQA